MEQPTPERAMRVVRLLQNNIYPTFQLYAQMGNKKTDPRDGLRLAALITLHWVRQRLDGKEGEELACLPGIEAFAEVLIHCHCVTTVATLNISRCNSRG